MKKISFYAEECIRRICFLSVLCAAVFCNRPVQAQTTAYTGYNFEWARAFNDNDTATTVHQYYRSTNYGLQRHIAKDTYGNMYVTGTFSQLITFGNIVLSSDDMFFNLYIAKMDPSGNWLWAKCLRVDTSTYSSGHIKACGITIDHENNVYITGEYYSYMTSIIFDSISIPPSSSGIFVAKINTSGKWLWAQHITGGGYFEKQGGYPSYGPYDVIKTYNNNVYITGIVVDGAIFGQNDIKFFSSNDPANPRSGHFVAKINSSGNWIWGKLIDMKIDYYYPMPPCIDIDIHGDLYVSGSFKGLIVFDTNTYIDISFQQLNIPNSIYVAKIDSSGNWLWAKAPEKTYHREPYPYLYFNVHAIAVDMYGDVYITGASSVDSIVFDKGISVAQGAIVAKMSSSGRWLWANSANGSRRPHYDPTQAYDIVIDKSGNPYILGLLQKYYELNSPPYPEGGLDTFTFGNIRYTPLAEYSIGALMQDTFSFIPASNTFLAKCDATTGDWLWVRDGGRGASGIGMIMDEADNIYITGYLGLGHSSFIGGYGYFDSSATNGGHAFSLSVFDSITVLWPQEKITYHNMEGGARFIAKLSPYIDSFSPQSAVRPLPLYSTDTLITVRWAGSDIRWPGDTAARIKHYSVYVSENGKAYVPWKDRITDTAAVFTGKYDSTYTFYSIATDHAGNEEAAPAVYDAITRIVDCRRQTQPVLDTLGDVVLCTGDTVTLRVTGGNSYVWNNKAGESELRVTVSGTYRVVVQDTFGCRWQLGPTFVKVMPPPAPPVITRSGDTLYSSYVSDNQWYLDSAAIPGAAQDWYIPQEDGIYRIVYTDSSGCTSVSDGFEYRAEVPTAGLHDLSGLQVSVFPNPTTGLCTVQGSLSTGREVRASLYDIFGRLVTGEVVPCEAGSFSYRLDLGNAPAGNYLLLLRSGTWQEPVRITKQ